MLIIVQVLSLYEWSEAIDVWTPVSWPALMALIALQELELLGQGWDHLLSAAAFSGVAFVVFLMFSGTALLPLRRSFDSQRSRLIGLLLLLTLGAAVIWFLHWDTYFRGYGRRITLGMLGANLVFAASSLFLATRRKHPSTARARLGLALLVEAWLLTTWIPILPEDWE